MESRVAGDNLSNASNGVEDDDDDSHELSDSLNAEDSKEAEEVAVLLPRDTPKVNTSKSKSAVSYAHIQSQGTTYEQEDNAKFLDLSMRVFSSRPKCL